MDKFDTIIVSGCSIPKIEILKHVFKNAEYGSNIIVREASRPTKSVIKLIDSYENINLIREMENRALSIMEWMSYLLIKR